jgi:hypothetical protein
VQYTIEARQLTNAMTRRREDGPRQMTVEAQNPDEAISKFVEQNESELVSFTEVGAGRESIATVRKEDSVFLVRVYRG